MTKTLSASAVARYLGVAVGSVTNWIAQGELRAGETPGGHHRVTVDDLVEFMHKHRLPVPPELVPSAPRVLVVDDEDAVRKLVREEILEARPHFEVMEAKDGFAAGELVASWKPDVVILDLRMPGLDGFEVCRRIKERPETKDTAVIAVTAYHSQNAEKRMLDCGAQAYLVKPVDSAVLLAQIDAAIERPARRMTQR